MTQSKFRRILLKLSGEALAGAQHVGINNETLTEVGQSIAKLVASGCEVAIVVGGLFSTTPIV